MHAKTLKTAKVFLTFLVFVLIISLIVSPQTYISSTLNGIDVWLTKVVPALFPFFFLTKLLTELNVVEKISKLLTPITKKLFKTPGISSYVFLMSIISGYPVGAKLISELFKKGVINNVDATKMNAFCSTSGPLFIVGTVGVCMFKSQTFGLIILISHILGAFLNGTLYRNYNQKQIEYSITSNSEKNSNNILSSILYDSIISILMVGGYIAIFFVFIDFLNNVGLINFLSIIPQKLFSQNVPEGFFSSIINGSVEVTRGLLDLSSLNLNKTLLCCSTTFLISFGGLSIHLQSIYFLKSAKIKISVYFLQKLTHAIFSTLICLGICLFL